MKTTPHTNIIFAIFSIFLLSPLHASADIKALRANSGKPRIIFYENPNYSGKTLAAYDAGEFRDLNDKDRTVTRDWNDSISSIELEGAFRVTLYSEKDFGGQSVTITTSQKNLFLLGSYDWDNQVSSVQWEPLDGSTVTPQAFFYEEPNYQGRSFILEIGDSISNLRDKRRGDRTKDWNDKISSVRIIGNLNLFLYQDTKYKGASLKLTKSSPNLYLKKRIDG